MRGILRRALFFSLFFMGCMAIAETRVQPARRALDIDNPNRPLGKRPNSGGIQGLGDPNKRRLGRKLASDSRRGYRRSSMFLGPRVSFEGPLAKVSSGDSLSRGLGYGVGLEVQYQTPLVRIGFQPAYRQLQLGRNIDGSGVLEDPTPFEVSQKIQYFGAGGWFSFNVEEGGGPGVFEPSWWVDLGTEVLFPLKAIQSSSIDGDLTLKPNKLWLILLGGTIDFEVQRDQLFKVGLHLFYNLPGNSQGRLFGVRAQIAFDLGLL